MWISRRRYNEMSLKLATLEGDQKWLRRDVVDAYNKIIALERVLGLVAVTPTQPWPVEYRKIDSDGGARA